MHDLIQNIKMLQSANRRLPGALWYCVGEAVFDTAHVYLPLWIFAWILQAVSDGDMQRFAVSAVLCVIVQAVTDWLSRLVQEKRIAYARRCNEVGINEVYEKIARLSYETYQDDEIRQRCNTALENLYYEFDYSDLIQEEAAILDNGCKVAAALCMTAVLLLQPPVIGGGWGLAAEPVVCGILFAAVTGLLIGMNLYRQKSREGERVRLLREHSATESRLLYLQNSVVFAFPQ